MLGFELQDYVPRRKDTNSFFLLLYEFWNCINFLWKIRKNLKTCEKLCFYPISRWLPRVWCFLKKCFMETVPDNFLKMITFFAHLFKSNLTFWCSTHMLDMHKLHIRCQVITVFSSVLVCLGLFIHSYGQIYGV